LGVRQVHESPRQHERNYGACRRIAKGDGFFFDHENLLQRAGKSRQEYARKSPRACGLVELLNDRFIDGLLAELPYSAEDMRSVGFHGAHWGSAARPPRGVW
jgi:hypothetical protein